jgi:hypothetical protein
VRVDEQSARVLVVNNFLGNGGGGELELHAGAGTVAGNIALEAGRGGSFLGRCGRSVVIPSLW